MEPPRRQSIKCVFVGTGAVGKTDFLRTYVNGVYPSEYLPTVFDDYSASVDVDGVPVTLSLCDTSGLDDYYKMRQIAYPQTDVFLICFSPMWPESFEDVRDKWYPEISAHSTDPPMVLVGLKADLRQDMETQRRLEQKSQKPITTAEADIMRKQIGASAYVECSAKNKEGLDDVFIAAVQAVWENEKGTSRKRRGCRIS